jgi:transcriptional regulator with XRE-family HTH domain
MEDLGVVARRLREARTRLGVSQERLGILAGIDEFSASARINQYERGKHVPAFEVAKQLAAALDVPTEYLYTEDDRTARLLMAYRRLPARAKTRWVESLELEVGDGKSL